MINSSQIKKKYQSNQSQYFMVTIQVTKHTIKLNDQHRAYMIINGMIKIENMTLNGMIKVKSRHVERCGQNR